MAAMYAALGMRVVVAPGCEVIFVPPLVYFIRDSPYKTNRWGLNLANCASFCAYEGGRDETDSAAGG